MDVPVKPFKCSSGSQKISSKGFDKLESHSRRIDKPVIALFNKFTGGTPT